MATDYSKSVQRYLIQRDKNTGWEGMQIVLNPFQVSLIPTKRTSASFCCFEADLFRFVKVMIHNSAQKIILTNICQTFLYDTLDLTSRYLIETLYFEVLWGSLSTNERFSVITGLDVSWDGQFLETQRLHPISSDFTVCWVRTFDFYYKNLVTFTRTSLSVCWKFLGEFYFCVSQWLETFLFYGSWLTVWRASAMST